MVCHQAIIWTDVGILLIGPLGTNFSEIVIKIHTTSSKKMHMKMWSAKWRTFCLSLSVLRSIHKVRKLLLWCTIIWFTYVNNPTSSEWNNDLNQNFIRWICWLHSQNLMFFKALNKSYDSLSLFLYTFTFKILLSYNTVWKNKDI